MNKIVVGVLLAFACSLGGCCGKKTEKPTPEPSKPAANVPAPTPTPPPPPDPKTEMRAKDTLPEAIAYAKPLMEDTRNDLDKGTVLLVDWLARKPSWGAINALPETSVAKVLKDSDAERGKRICAGGTVVQIASDKIDGKKIFNGTFMTGDVKYIAYFAVASTGSLVERSPGKFCGVVTGTHSYSNTGGGTTHAIRVVGMFDLPENRKEAP